ncbi:hypothetical protein GUJ93_ZPchr0009g1864 [Zizania palustris]|nr:hypothetical protein GUJ93_ZPchr0009g1864 [Zizania palustris]
MKFRRELLLCELAETDCAIAARFAGGSQPTSTLAWPQGDLLPSSHTASHTAREYAWRGEPSTPLPSPWDESHPHALAAPRSSDREPPWWCRSPTAVTIPVYPHVRSPSPIPQDGDEKKEHGGTSGSSARAPPVQQPAPHAEWHSQPLPIKEETTVQETVFQTEANADVKPVLLSLGLTPRSQCAMGQEKEEREIATDGHAMQLLGESIGKSSEQPMPTESITSDWIDEEIAPFDDQKRVEFTAEFTPERRFSGLKRQLTAATSPSPVKKLRSQENYNCSLCQVTMTCLHDLVEHRASVLHRSNLTPLQSGKKTILGTLTNTEAESSKWNWSSAAYYQANYTSESDSQKHLGGSGRRHRDENMVVLAPPHAGGGRGARNEEESKRGASGGADAADPRRKTAASQSWTFCEVCSVRCSSEKVMLSHLAGKKHREMSHLAGKNHREMRRPQDRS